jgi:hypothetical protein
MVRGVQHVRPPVEQLSSRYRATLMLVKRYLLISNID